MPDDMDRDAKPAAGPLSRRGPGGRAAMAQAVEQARAALPGVVTRLLDEVQAPTRQTMGVVAACKAIIELATREDAGDAPRDAPAAVIVVTQGDLRSELEARGRGAKVLTVGSGANGSNGHGHGQH